MYAGVSGPGRRADRAAFSAQGSRQQGCASQNRSRPGCRAGARELFQVLRWFALTYGRDPQRLRGCRFASPAPQPRGRHHPAGPEPRAAAGPGGTTGRARWPAARATPRHPRLPEELDRLRQEITALRQANAAAAQPEPDLPEVDTRRCYIDHYLEEAGWVHGQSCTHEHEVEGMPNATGNGFVDYVLWGDDGKPLALVEAKRSRRDPMDGQHQAELYANALERHGQRPLIFLSNGYRHRLWDDLRYPPREVQGFYKKTSSKP